jgi:hypothetical protein
VFVHPIYDIQNPILYVTLPHIPFHPSPTLAA